MSDRTRGPDRPSAQRALVLAITAVVALSLPYVHLPGSPTAPARYSGTALGGQAESAIELAAARASLAAGFGPAAGISNGTWTDNVPTLTSLPEFTYDAADGYLVVFQGLVSQAWNSTWVFVHGDWTQLNESSAPTNRFGASIAYDTADREVVLFGGFDAGYTNFAYNDTWTFQKGLWTKLPASTSGAPSPRGYATMAFDPAVGKLILFGGQSEWDCTKTCAPTILDDTWSFAKGIWHKVPTGSSTPPRRADESMAFDPSTGNMTMFGGYNASYTLYSNASHPHPIREWGTSPRNDTWSYRAGIWQKIASGGPSGGSNSLFFIPGLNKTILFDSSNGGTWGLSNRSWSRLAVAAPPREGEPFTYDGMLGQIVQFGVTLATFNGTNWTTQENPLSPPGGGQPLLVYDSLAGYVIGYNSGLAETWVFQNGTWSDITSTTGKYQPAFRGGATFTFDAADNESILFGGVGCRFGFGGSEICTSYNDTWALRNGHWTDLRTVHSPPRPIYGAATAYDSRDREVILFGGRDWKAPISCFCNGPYLNETWVFSVGNWTELTNTSAVPAARDKFELVDDPSAGGVVMFGGEESSAAFSGAGNDTWLFSAGNWTRITSPLVPSGREAYSMTYDSATNELLLFGGAGSGCYSYCGGYASSQLWAFSNGSWSVVNFGTQFVPAARAGADFIYAPPEGYCLLFGGTTPRDASGVWTLILT